MSIISSKVARQGSAASSTASRDQSSHNHRFSQLLSIPQQSMHEVWRTHTHRHERILVGATATGMAILTREMMGMHIQQTPDARDMLDYLPVAGKDNSIAFLGWRQKLGTWPNSKQYPYKRL